MARVIVGMTTSLDGFVADPRGNVGRLYKAAARDRAFQVVGGVSVIQQLLVAGLVDEVHVDLMPLFLGSGLRLFDNPDLERVHLEKIDVREVGARTSFRFRAKAR